MMNVWPDVSGDRVVAMGVVDVLFLFDPLYLFVSYAKVLTSLMFVLL